MPAFAEATAGKRVKKTASEGVKPPRPLSFKPVKAKYLAYFPKR